MKRNYVIPAVLTLTGIGIITSLLLLILLNPFSSSEQPEDAQQHNECTERGLANKEPTLRTTTCKKSVDLKQIFSGGPGKDGIPAIHNPAFVPYDQSPVSDTTRGILTTINNETRFYPYNILAWHEIVNDSAGSTHYAITFCPLCDSGIVFDRTVENETLQFGVSGLLYQSNLLMYDNETESLWSQAGRRAIVGDYTGTQLDVLPFQLLSFQEVKTLYPNGMILSTDTGYNRDYDLTPYSGYLENEEIFFPVSVNDKRFPSKELMYVVPFKNVSLTFPYRQFQEGEQNFIIEGHPITITRIKNEIRATSDGVQYPGYFELWFSWATHNQEHGIVLDINTAE
ncbi:MAG: DUF3179 domain-containing protein [Candidatus Spechtbacteria bacterium SB0662_bin_43]|uniref:DUF3179 domain-containing protein n=1 Tax=Candidatus Spechtbacteria bacterium SB0662_bin_43 TaxID=2604897 RepID=A0A845DEH1_9BACT|nr:DUF3179 domain-containing protein [Candidatus Spechtbacteria bacterium SB0662_bin_43]